MLERERLARYEPGGAPQNPIGVSSASVVEAQALGVMCLCCGAQHSKLEEHAARDFSGQRLRVVSIRCIRCAAPRTLYFRVGPPLAS